MKTKRLMQLCLAAGAAALISPLALAESARYTLADEGNAVMDAKTGLVWKRCEEGKSFENGICKGLGIRYTWSEVEELKVAGWRLPTAEELKTLKEDTGVAPPINREFFPNTDRAWFWSSSVGTRDAEGCIQNVYFGDNVLRWCPAIRGGGEQLALKPAYVRLVRNN
jgi:hypothetical protein